MDTAKNTIEVLETKNAELEAEITALKEKLRLAQSKEFGKSSEQSSTPTPDESNCGERTTVSGYTRKAKNSPRGKTTDLSHLPLYRQSLMLANLDAPISDNTLGNWVMQVGDGLLPLYYALWKAILGSRYLQVDETPVKMLKPDKQGYLWTYFAPLVGQGLVVFEASLTRSGEVAKKRLAPFNGLLQTDAYNGYQSLRSRKGIIPCHYPCAFL